MEPQAKATADIDGGTVSPASSLWSELQSAHDRHPDKTAIISTDQQFDHLEGLVGQPPPSAPMRAHLAWSYGQVRKGASRMASVLESAQVPNRSVLVIFLPNVAEFALFLWLAALSELTLVPLDPRALEPARKDELEFFIDSLQPSVVVVPDGSGARAVDAVQEKLSSKSPLKISLSFPEDGLPQSWVSMHAIAQRQFIESDGNRSGPSKDDPDRIATVLFTSGTSTGQPKGCPRTARSWLYELGNKDVFRACDPDSVTLIQSVVFRGIALAVTTYMFTIGCTVVLAPQPFAPSTTLETIGTNNVTMIACVPTQIYVLGEDASYSKKRVQSVKNVFIGGDVNTTELFNMAQETFPNATVVTAHGMTEGSGVIGWRDLPACMREKPVINGVVASGVALPGARVRIVDDNTKRNVLKRGEVGELHISSQRMIDRYLGNVRPELFYEDSEGKWIITGDMACISEKGYVHIFGRSKDVIKKGGIPIVPSAIESCLGVHAGVKAVVIGLPHRKLGEQPYAIIEHLDNSPPVTDLENLVTKIFGDEYALGGVFTLQDLGYATWPKNASDKFSKLDLKKAALHRLSQ